MRRSPDTEGRIFMSNIKNAFEEEKGIYCHLFTCGDPDLETTKQS